VIVTAHCENADLVLALQKQLLSEGKTGPEYHYWSRPPRVEAEGVHHLLTFAEMTGAHTYIVHTSCEEALNEAMAGKARGLNVWVETLIQYLVLDKSYAELPNFEGAKYVMSPPLRDKREPGGVLERAEAGFVHRGHRPRAVRLQGPERDGPRRLHQDPKRHPSLEDRVNLLYTYGVTTGRIDLHTFVDCASTQAAKIFGLFPRKGTIAVGSDADLVVYDPNYRGTISAKTHHLNLDYSAFEGWEIKGRPSVVTVRGEVAVRDGQFVGTIGRGQFLKREPTHF
jgi:dihydropyrimidinase